MEERIEDYIKRIESIIKTLSEHIEFEDYDEDVLKEASEDKEAIENLLKRYKELEEENERLIIAKAEALQEMRKYKAKYENLKIRHNGTKEALRIAEDLEKQYSQEASNLEAELDNSIPISVIQNKKRELEKKKEYLWDEYDESVVEVMCRYSSAIKVLDELLEERNK